MYCIENENVLFYLFYSFEKRNALLEYHHQITILTLITLSVSFPFPSCKISPASLVDISEARSHVTVGIMGLGWASMVAICLSPSRGEVLLFLSTDPPAPDSVPFLLFPLMVLKLVTASCGDFLGGFLMPLRALCFAAKYILMQTKTMMQDGM